MPLLVPVSNGEQIMKRVCAWCSKTLNQIDSPEPGLVTHGICEECRSVAFVSAQHAEIRLRAAGNEAAGGDALESAGPVSDV